MKNIIVVGKVLCTVMALYAIDPPAARTVIARVEDSVAAVLLLNRKNISPTTAFQVPRTTTNASDRD